MTIVYRKVCVQTTTMSIYKGASRKKYVNKRIDKNNVFFFKGVTILDPGLAQYSL